MQDDALRTLLQSSNSNQYTAASTMDGGTPHHKGGMANLDLQEKVRQLELQIIDLKAQTERKFSQIQEEIPNRVDRDLKRLELKEHETQKTSSAQIQMTAE